MSVRLEIRLPQSPDAFGRWLEENGASVEISCSLGQFSVTVTRHKLHSYADKTGSHREEWSLSRYGKDFCEVLREAMRASGMPIA